MFLIFYTRSVLLLFVRISFLPPPSPSKMRSPGMAHPANPMFGAPMTGFHGIGGGLQGLNFGTSFNTAVPLGWAIGPPTGHPMGQAHHAQQQQEQELQQLRHHPGQGQEQHLQRQQQFQGHHGLMPLSSMGMVPHAGFVAHPPQVHDRKCSLRGMREFFFLGCERLVYLP